MKKTVLFLSFIVILLLSSCGMGTPAMLPVERALSDSGASYGNAAAPASNVIAGSGAPSAQESSGPDNRIVLMNASRTLVVNDPADAASKISAMAAAKGGWVVSSNVTQNTYGADGATYYSGDITIRVPAAKLDETLTEIEALAVEVKSRLLTGQDVTAQYTDLQSQLRNLQAAETRLLDIMSNATDTEAVLAVETQLQQVQGQIEVLQGQIRMYDESAQYASISVSLEPYIPSQPIDIGGWHPEGTAKQAVETLVHTLQGLVDTLIYLGICGLPALLLVALIILPIYLVSRAIIRRSKKAS
jgi:hypothetical protein